MVSRESLGSYTWQSPENFDLQAQPCSFHNTTNHFTSLGLGVPELRSQESEASLPDSLGCYQDLPKRGNKKVSTIENEYMVGDDLL